MSTAAREAPHHNTLTCVKEYGCKRPECVARCQAYHRNRHRKMGYGTWQPLVDAEPARRHINQLRDLGHSIPGIEKAAQVSPATLSRIIYDGTNKRVRRLRPEVAARILVIPLVAPPVKAHTIVDATGTRRRVQALVAMGWPLNALGPQLGIHPRRLSDLIRSDRVLASTAQRIARAYRTVQTRDPRNHGVPDRSIAMARNLAAREGWRGPLDWDDIDAPDSRPESWGRSRAKRGSRRVAVDRTTVAQLTAAGRTAQQIADELGCHKRTVVRARGRAEMAVAA